MRAVEPARIDPQQSVTFSRRLSGKTAHLVFLVFTLLAALLAVANAREHPLNLAVVLALLILYTVTGTLVWQRILQRHSAESVYRYFAVQIGLLLLTMLVEIQATQYGPGTALLTFPLVLQSNVLPRRWIVFGVVLAMVSLIYAVDLPADEWFVSRLSPIILFYGVAFYGMLMFGRQIVREERAVQTSHDLARYATEVEEIAMLRERNRLAREIHDNLGHYLTAVNMQIEAALAMLDADQERTRQALSKAQTLTKEGLAEIRRSINALRANPVENRALHEAILLLVEEHRTAGNGVDYQIQGDIRPCSAAIEMALYRIAQEGLTNIRKHARATHADLILNYRDPTRVCLEVRDNGKGSQQDGSSGFGLLGIRERVQLLGGTLTVHSASGQGFALLVGIPS